MKFETNISNLVTNLRNGLNEHQLSFTFPPREFVGRSQTLDNVNSQENRRDIESSQRHNLQDPGVIKFLGKNCL